MLSLKGFNMNSHGQRPWNIRKIMVTTLKGLNYYEAISIRLLFCTDFSNSHGLQAVDDKIIMLALAEILRSVV
jgi:hypothetical protein